jgi:hypothetical protein
MPSSTQPIVLIMGCQKYRASLLAAMARTCNSAYRTIGLIGGAEDSFDGSLLTLRVEDSYEFLPRKVQAAFRWINANFAETEGVFKTDDDIFFADQSELVSQIVARVSIPYWGVFVSHTSGGVVDRKRILMGENHEIEATYQAAVYCYGHGYWISKEAIPLVCASTEHATDFLEDVTMGFVMNRAGHVPLHVCIPYSERPR